MHVVCICRFAPPSEQRPPKGQRVSIQVVEAGGDPPHGGTPGSGSKRLAGSFQRLHGAYVNLPEPGSGGQHMAPPPQVSFPPLVQQSRAMQQGALLPVLTVEPKEVFGRAAAEGRGGMGPMPESPRTSGPASGGVGGANYIDRLPYGDVAGPGPSPDMLGPDVAWHPLEAPPRPKSAVQFRRRMDTPEASAVGLGPHSQSGTSWQQQQQQQQRPRSASAASRENSSSPPRPGPYGGMSSQSPGGYLVRNITATPQKGFTRNTAGRAGSGRAGEGFRTTNIQQQQQVQGSTGTRWTMGRFVTLEEGQGLPQVSIWWQQTCPRATSRLYVSTNSSPIGGWPFESFGLI